MCFKGYRGDLGFVPLIMFKKDLMSNLYLLTRWAMTISALFCDSKAEANSASSWEGEISTRFLLVRRRFLRREGGAVVASWVDSAVDRGGRRGRGLDEAGKGVWAIPAIRMERLGGMFDGLGVGGMKKIGDAIDGMLR